LGILVPLSNHTLAHDHTLPFPLDVFLNPCCESINGRERLNALFPFYCPLLPVGVPSSPPPCFRIFQLVADISSLFEGPSTLTPSHDLPPPQPPCRSDVSSGFHIVAFFLLPPVSRSSSTPRPGSSQKVGVPFQKSSPKSLPLTLFPPP